MTPPDFGQSTFSGSEYPEDLIVSFYQRNFDKPVTDDLKSEGRSVALQMIRNDLKTWLDHEENQALQIRLIKMLDPNFPNPEGLIEAWDVRESNLDSLVSRNPNFAKISEYLVEQAKEMQGSENVLESENAELVQAFEFLARILNS